MSRICLSHIINQEIPSYGNRDRFFIRTNSSIEKGETANSSSWFFSNNHIVTHIDVPFHFSTIGKKTYEIPIDYFFFKNCQLIDIICDGPRIIEIRDIEATQLVDSNIEMLLIRTGYEKYRNDDSYWNNNPGLSPQLANFLRVHFPSLRCVGFDFISLTSWKYRELGRKSHEEFLCPEDGSDGILVIEDMALSKVNSLIREVVVAPLFVEDGNGGAVTVFAELE
jgi:arylformamidase